MFPFPVDIYYRNILTAVIFSHNVLAASQFYVVVALCTSAITNDENLRKLRHMKLNGSLENF